MDREVHIVEITPRDGFQSVKEYIPLERKLEIIERILRAGVEKIQAGSFVSPKAIPQMKDAVELFTALLARHPKAGIFALVPNLFGAKAAIGCGLKEIATVISVSESHNKANINRTVDESMEQLAEIRETFPDITLQLDAATAFGCPFEGTTPLDRLLAYIGRAVNIGVDSVNLCDTIGVAYPLQVETVIRAVKKEFPDLALQIHIHDTRNMGMINTWTAINCGVTTVQTALGGLGGCPFAPGASGNTATEDLVYMLHKNGLKTGIDFDKLLDAAKYMRTVIDGNFSGHHINISACYNEAGQAGVKGWSEHGAEQWRKSFLSGRGNLSDCTAGDIVTAKVDCAMMDDILGPRVMIDEAMKRFHARIWDPAKTVIISDHYTPAATAEQADIVAFTRNWAKEYGVENYFEGVGPCHQILAEQGFSLPGTLQVGTDSHTCTAGAFGCFGTGIGSTEMAGVLITGEIWLRVPESILFVWNGALSPGVMAKDIILRSIGDIGHAGGYLYGDGV